MILFKKSRNNNYEIRIIDKESKIINYDIINNNEMSIIDIEIEKENEYEIYYDKEIRNRYDIDINKINNNYYLIILKKNNKDNKGGEIKIINKNEELIYNIRDDIINYEIENISYLFN